MQSKNFERKCMLCEKYIYMNSFSFFTVTLPPTALEAPVYRTSGR